MESRIIMDTTGAEKLLGRGDMLYHPLGSAKPKRIQGAFIGSDEIERVIAHVKTTGAVEYSEEAQAHIEQSEGDSATGYDAAEDEDPLLQDAVSIVVSSGQASTSMLQRRLKLGYARAARVMDQMEERGIIGPSEGSKPRRVLITKDEWMEIQLRREI
jgi:S-DNA-T family DNA segregation ATPase FtsK/SpoIIIE